MNLPIRGALLRAALFGVTLLFASACPAQVEEGPSKAAGLPNSIIGDWKGTLTLREPLSKKTAGVQGEPDLMPMQILIEQDKARVFVEHHGKMTEVMPGRLTLIAVGRLAVISGWTAGEADDGKHPWIESIAILVHSESPNELVAEWRRVVNNVGVPTEGKVTPAWSVAFGGLLQLHPGKAAKK